MAGLNDDDLKGLLDGELRQSVGYFGGRLANARQKALYYFEGLPKGDLSPPEIEGRSTIVSTEVRNIILSMLPSVMEKYASGDAVVEARPKTRKAEQNAQDVTDYLNFVFLNQCNGHRILETAFMDAMISKAGIVKVWWDDRSEETREEYRGLTDIELAEIVDDEEVEPIEHSAYHDEEAAEQKQQAIQQIQHQLAQAQYPQQQQQLMLQSQQIEQMPVPNLHDITVKRTKLGGKIQIENVPPEEFMVSRKIKSLDPDKEPNFFVAHRVLRSTSELLSMGYKQSLVDSLTSDDTQGMYSMERIERMTWDDDYAYMNQSEMPSYDESQKLLVLHECYVKVDFDGDGIAELRRVLKCGNTILDNDAVDVVPFAVFRPLHMPHRFFGLSVADLAMEPQRIQTSILRAMLDNLYLQVNGRYFAVEGQVNLDDLLTSRPGGVVRIRQQGAVGRLDQSAGDGASAMAMMQYMREVTEESTGWSRTANAADDPNSINLTATAANLASNKASQRTDMIARNLGEGVKEMFRLILKLVCQHQDRIEDMNLGQRWVSIDPREWRNGYEIEISVGLGTGSKDQQVQHLSLLLQAQKEALQVGIATPANIYASLKKLTGALGFRNPDMFWTDPEQNPRQQQPNPDMMKLQADQQKFQAQSQLDIQKFQAQAQLEREKEQMQWEFRQKELQLEAMKQEQQAQNDMQERQHQAALNAQLEQQRLEFDKWKAMLQAEVQLATAQISASKGTDAETTQAADGSANALLTAIIEKLSAPKTIIRDENGRAMGIQ